MRATGTGRAVVAAIVTALVLAACGPGAATSASPATMELQLYAAASLKGVLATLSDAYAAANPGVTFAVSTDSTAALATKIEQGAPVDLFLAADTTHPQRLVDGRLAAGGVVPFAGNRLAIIVPTANPAGITTPADLATPGVKIVAAGDAVPITTYATRLVANLAALPGAPSGFEAAYAANIVSREDSVAGIVAKVRLGEGDAGIVYATDAAGREDVTSVAVPETANVPVTYGAVLVRAGAHPDAAAAFLAWLAGPDALAILATAGFTPAP